MRECEILVIGGGIAGTSLLYHLARLGRRDAVLLEKDELTSGSTWHAAGLCTQFNSSAALMKLLRSSIDLYDALEAETGQVVDLHRCGSVRLATSEARMEEFRQRQGLAQSLGIPFELIPPERVVELFPLVDPAGLLGAAHLPTDGFVDPTSVTNALAQGALARGAEIRRRTRVRAIERQGDAWHVETSGEPIRAHTVINAAGQWAPEIGRMVGVRLPIVPLEHHYVITEPIDEVRALPTRLPVLRDVDASYYVREEGGGLLVGPFERHTRVWGQDGIPEDFHSELLPPDLERLEPILEAAARRIPVFEGAGIRTALNGPDGYTPDGRCLMGPLPGLPNFHVLAGFSIFGIVFSGGAGRYAAEWICEGRPSDDLWELDVRRFHPEQTAPDYVAGRSLELYGDEYAIHYPDEESVAGRPLRTGPLYPEQRDAGAVFGSALGFERPLWFDTGGAGLTPSFRRGDGATRVAEECQAVEAGAGLLDDSPLALFDLSGEDAPAAFDALCAARCPELGGGTLAPFCNPLGGVECGVRAWRLGEHHIRLVGGAPMACHHEAWLAEQLAAFGGAVQLEVRTGSLGVLRLLGSTAPEALAALGAEVPTAPCTLADTELAGCRVTLQRCDEVVAGEFEIHHRLGDQRTLYRALHDAGASFGLRTVGTRAYDALRLERGCFLGRELSTHRTPFEMGWGHVVDPKKSEFTGRAALLATGGADPPLRLLAVEGDPSGASDPSRAKDPVGGEAIWHGSECVGSVAIGGYGYRTGRVLAWAFLPGELGTPETTLSVQILGERRRAVVIAPPDPLGPLSIRWS